MFTDKMTDVYSEYRLVMSFTFMFREQK